MTIAKKHQFSNDPRRFEAARDALINQRDAHEIDPLEKALLETCIEALDIATERGGDPDHIYDRNDWDATFNWDSPAELAAGRIDTGEYMAIGCLKELPDKYLAAVPVDICPDTGDCYSDLKIFNTEEEAIAACNYKQEDTGQ